MTAFDESKATFGSFEDRAVWLIAKLLPDFPKWGVLDAYACAGNLGGESLIQMIQEGGQTPPNGGWGLPQWTGPRRTAFYAYCARTGRDIASMRAGYDYLFVELKGAYAAVIDEVAVAPDLAAKVLAFEQHFEMAGIPRLGNRLQYALRAQKAWEANPANKLVPAPLPAPGGAPPVPAPQPPAPVPGPTKGPSSMFNIANLLGVISSAPTIIGSGITLIEELDAGYQKAKADPKANLLTYVEDMMAALVANKGAIATAVLGNEPKVAADGTPK